jgi:release factor glutamine methyltransferase
MVIYEPEEDSYLLQEQVEKLAHGRVLDIGTGSGIQAICASQKKEVCEVVAVDIDEEAVFGLKKKKLAGVKVHRSDLFQSVKGIFDTIIFNPPYLPDDALDKDIALDGGRQGHELIQRFLEEAKSHLAKDGIILMVFSNRTGPETKSMMQKAGYFADLLSSKELPFFEKLYVYRLFLNNTREAFAKGKRGLIYREGKVCIKERNPDSKKDSLANEAEFLQILNKKNIGPGFISFDGKQLKREFVEGIEMGCFIETSGKKTIISVIRQVLMQCREMDKMGINKTELTNPHKDIIITREKKAVMIDFERCKRSDKPQNVTQFLQYITRKKGDLESRGIKVSRERLITLGKAYKDSFEDKTFKNIMDSFA